MLTMRRRKAFVLSLVETERAYDILDGDTAVAVVSYLKNKGGKVTIEGKEYPIVRSGGPSSEMLYQAVVRLVSGRARVPASWSLTGIDGKTIATAQHSREGFAVTRGSETFSFRKSKRRGPFELFRSGSEQALGSTSGMALPADYDLPFQAFLFALVAALGQEEVDSSPGSVS